MCVSMDLADFSGTILYAGRRHHPQHGLIEVIGYQNTAVNLATGPNAMLLHLPALPMSMSAENFLQVGRSTDVLTRMVDAVRPRSVGLPPTTDWMGIRAEQAVQVFEHDIYTVLLAADPTQLPTALRQVPERKRPHLNPALMEFYADLFPDYTIAVCCFDNAEAQRAKPLMMWYEPVEPDRLVAPALDCHTGEPPSLDDLVSTDHWVLFGSDQAPEGWGEPVDYPTDMSHRLRQFLPDTVLGAHFSSESMHNGDFTITHDDLLNSDLLNSDLTTINRRQPTR